MKLKSLSPQATQLTFNNGVEVLFSYETPVMVRDQQGKLFQTKTKHSNTTMRHITKFKKDEFAFLIDQKYIDMLVIETQ